MLEDGWQGEADLAEVGKIVDDALQFEPAAADRETVDLRWTPIVRNQ